MLHTVFFENKTYNVSQTECKIIQMNRRNHLMYKSIVIRPLCASVT